MSGAHKASKTCTSDNVDRNDFDLIDTPVLGGAGPTTAVLVMAPSRRSHFSFRIEIVADSRKHRASV